MLLSLPQQMPLRSNCIRFPDPRGELVVELRQTVEPKRVQMISWRERFDAREASMLNAASKDKVTN